MTQAPMESSPGRAAGREKYRQNNNEQEKYTTTAAPVESVLSRLDAVRNIGGSKWLARCPSHEDRTPSLSIRETDEGTVLLNCFAGCSAGEVLTAVGLEFGDLFPDGPVARHIKGRKRPRQNPRDVLANVSHALTVVSLADSKLGLGAPLNDDERDSIARALRVLGKFQKGVA